MNFWGQEEGGEEWYPCVVLPCQELLCQILMSLSSAAGSLGVMLCQPEEELIRFCW